MSRLRSPFHPIPILFFMLQAHLAKARQLAGRQSVGSPDRERYVFRELWHEAYADSTRGSVGAPENASIFPFLGSLCRFQPRQRALQGEEKTLQRPGAHAAAECYGLFQGFEALAFVVHGQVESLLLTLEAASNNLELVLHLIPDTLRESISNGKFVSLPGSIASNEAAVQGVSGNSRPLTRRSVVSSPQMICWM